MDEKHEAWLRSHHEEPIEPLIPICDSNHHLWKFWPSPDPDAKPPVDGAEPGRYLLDEFYADGVSALNVTQSVFVECRSDFYQSGPDAFKPVGETEFVVRTVREDARPRIVSGIVGYANLQSDDIEAVLDAHITAGDGMFRGIRHLTAYDPSPAAPKVHTRPDPGLLEDRRFRAGVAALERRSLSFDAWVFHPQLPELADLARDRPDTTIILNHFGGPLKVGPYAEHPDETSAAWRAGMQQVAKCPNVFLKLSGMGMRAYGDDWRGPTAPTSQEVADAWGDRVRWCIETFGADRCMFGSNFPVDRLAFSYVVVWNAFKRMVAGTTKGEMSLLFHDSACRAYQLEPAGPSG
jgi:predicted TIM-barrel fold metal-dependent hydrolase